MNSTGSYDASQAKFSKFDEMSPNSRSFYLRTFGKIEAGALRAAIFTLISTAIGAGCLTLPLIFKEQGIILGIILLTFTCVLSLTGIMAITSASENFKIYEYSALIDKVLGRKWKIIFDNTVILYVFGTLIGYQVLVGSYVPSVLSSINVNFNPDIERYLIMLFANIVIMVPLGLMRTLTSLRFMSIVSGLTLLYIALLIIIEFPFFAKNHSYDNINLFSPNLSTFAALNICLYSFSCHINVSQVYDELQRRNLKRMGKVAARAMFSILIPYTSLALFGYLSTMNDTPNLIIMRRAPDSISNDWLMVLARVLMSITLIIGVPISLPPCRRAIIKSWLRINDDKPSTRVHCSVTIGILWTTMIVAMFYPNILVLFSVLGGFCCGILMIVLPALLKIKTENYEPNSLKEILLKYGCALLFMCGCTGAVLSDNMRKGFKK